MTDREHFAALLADAKIMFWTCLNEDHKYVTWTGDVATCDTCGLTSEMTARFARDVQRWERERIASEISPDRLEELAGWFDDDDDFKAIIFPQTLGRARGHDVQDDLRHWAKLLRGEEDGND